MTTYWLNPSAASDGNGTSRDDPYNTWASVPTLAAGDIVEVEPSSGQIMTAQYAVSGSGTSVSPITIRKNPAVAGTNPLFTVSAEGANGFLLSGKSYIRFENIDVLGLSSWTSQTTCAFKINGSFSDVRLTGCNCTYARIDLSGGFAVNGVSIESCSSQYNTSDGLRFFSGAGTYTWQNVTVIGGSYRFNGTAHGANGSGINIQIQSGHTGTTLQDFRIAGTNSSDNYVGGIEAQDNADSFTTVSSAANTTPPVKRIHGLRITRNTASRNGSSGIAILGAQPSSDMSCIVSMNTCEDNSTNATLGNLWTAFSKSLLIELNVCRRANSNGTSVGDGEGIFDDQWNDSTVCRWNLVEDNVFNAAINPDLTSYGIGIYRTSNSVHYGNTIRGCRYGYYIGSVPTSTAPVMTGIKVWNNTIVDTTNKAIQINYMLGASAIDFSNNVLVNAAQDIGADSGTAGNQAFHSNIAVNVPIKYTGNNVPSTAFDHTITDAMITADSIPMDGSPLLPGSYWTDVGYMDTPTGQGKQFGGAFCPATMLQTA